MYAHCIPAVAVFGSMLLALLPSLSNTHLSNTQAQAGAGRPRVIEVSSLAPEKNVAPINRKIAVSSCHSVGILKK